MSAFFSRKDVMLTIIIVFFLINVVPYFFVSNELAYVSTRLVAIVSVVNAFALSLAVFAQTKRSYINIKQKIRGWPYDVMLLAMLYGMLAIGVFLGESSTAWQWTLSAIQFPINSVIFSIQAFYMASVMARSLRTKNIRILLLNVGIILTMLYQAPFTTTVFPGITPVYSYLSTAFTTTFSRVFTMGIALGSLALGVRVLMGREMGIVGFMEKATEG